MPIIKNINPVTEILQQSGIIPATSKNGKVSKKDLLLQQLEARGIDIPTLAEAIQSQFYSADENIRDKAINRMLQLNEIVKKDDLVNIPQVTFVLQTNGNSDVSLNTILVPREI